MPGPTPTLLSTTGLLSDPTVLIAGIVVPAVGLNRPAVRTRTPAILAYLVTGFLLGPVLGVLDPDELLGDLLLPAVSLAVGLILFEGGPSLRPEHRQGRHDPEAAERRGWKMTLNQFVPPSP